MEHETFCVCGGADVGPLHLIFKTNNKTLHSKLSRQSAQNEVTGKLTAYFKENTLELCPACVKKDEITYDYRTWWELKRIIIIKKFPEKLQ